MGSQSLEILRQGVWASLTGGWFYDPRLDVFSNTFHLYVWLFLLCLPFTIYLFLPPTLYVWLAYCACVVTLFGTIKCVNHALHSVYDTSECLEEPEPVISQQKLESEKRRAARSKRGETQSQDPTDNGIELQVLNENRTLGRGTEIEIERLFDKGKTETPPVECSSRNSYMEANVENADADSITSDYNREKPNSTIDLKVEIHRKNSSESSEDATASEELAGKETPEGNNEYTREEKEASAEQIGARRSKVNGTRIKCQRCVVMARDERPCSRKLCRHGSEESQSRHSRVVATPGTLGKTGSESRIKQTSSLELEEPGEDYPYYPYWKSNQSVRRLNSNSIPMETHLTTDHPQSMEIISKKKMDHGDKNKMPSHPQSLEVIAKKLHQQLVHPQSLETIGGAATSKNATTLDDNNLPLHPQSLETINTNKKGLPQNTLKRNQLQLLPYLSYGSEIVHPIAEQSDEQFANENSAAGYSLRDSYSPLLAGKRIDESCNRSNRDRSLSTGGLKDRFSR